MKSNLKELRKRYGMRQHEFASLIGVSRSHMCQLENEKRIPSLDLAFKIAGIFKANIEEIWTK
jgi:putative transcriptional regulator